MLSLSRRAVLALGASGAGAAAIATAGSTTPVFGVASTRQRVASSSSAAAAAASSSETAAPDAGTAPLDRSHFAPGVGAAFTARQGTRSYQVTLTEIRDVPNAAGSESRFVLLFSIRPADDPADGIYSLVAPQVSATTLFLSTVASGAGGRSWQAVINQTS